MLFALGGTSWLGRGSGEGSSTLEMLPGLMGTGTILPWRRESFTRVSPGAFGEGREDSSPISPWRGPATRGFSRGEPGPY